MLRGWGAGTTPAPLLLFLMKVVYLSAAKLPSAAANTIHVVNMCQAYRDSGCEVLLIVARRTEGYDEIKKFYGVEGNFDIEETGKSSFLRKSWWYTFYVLKKLKGLKADLVHGRFLKACFCAAAFLNKKVVFEVHQPVFETKSFIDMILFKVGSRRIFSKVVVISDSLARFFIKEGVPEDRLLVLHDGSADVEVKRCNVDYIRVGYAGKLDPYKGKAVVEDLSNFLKRIFRKVEVFVSGRGSEKFVPPSEVKNLLATFDICLLPLQGRGRLGSIFLDFSSPLKLFDYMSVGGCIVASRLSSIEEVLSDKNAVLVPPQDLDMWRNVVARLIMLPSLRKKMSIGARADFCRFYTWKRRAERILRSVASRAAPTAPVNWG